MEKQEKAVESIENHGKAQKAWKSKGKHGKAYKESPWNPCGIPVESPWKVLTDFLASDWEMNYVPMVFFGTHWISVWESMERHRKV